MPMIFCTKIVLETHIKYIMNQFGYLNVTFDFANVKGFVRELHGKSLRTALLLTFYYLEGPQAD